MHAQLSSSLRPLPRRGLGSLLLLSALAACHDSGGKSSTPGTVGPPAQPTLTVDFGLRRDISLGSTFVGDVLHVDLNQDGVPDLVASNFLPKQVNIALGAADGSFAGIATRSTLGNTWRLASGDFNDDGLEDVAVLSQDYRGFGASGVEVFLQGPTLGEFSAAALQLGFGKDPIDLAVAPVSGTNRGTGGDELFVAIRNESRVARIRVEGGVLSEVESLDSSSLGDPGGASSIASIDLGGDGFYDLVVGEENVPGSSDRVVRYARGAGGFDPAQLVMAPLFRPVVDNTGDMDANGFEDIAIAQLESTEVYLLQGDASGLSMATSLDFGAETTSLLFPDLDGDGFAEAVATTLDQGSIQVLPGTGPMAWGDAAHYNVGPIPRALDTILLPGDDIPDLLCANSRDLSVMYGLGDGTFRAARGYDSGGDGISRVVLGDLDNDGNEDAVSVSRQQQSITFYRGNGNGRLAALTVLPLVPTLEDEPGHIELADLDGDGDLDVLTSVLALDEIRFYRNPTVIEDFEDPPINDIAATEAGPLGFCVCDMNGDTLPDVVVACAVEGTVQVLLNNGLGQVNGTAGIPVGGEPCGVEAMDFDGDGDLDIVAVSETGTGAEVVILEGDGEGGLEVVGTNVLDGPSDSVALGDFNEDGMPDVVVGQTESSGDEVFLLINQQGLAFETRRLQVGEGPAVVVVEDLNNDLHLDVLVGTTVGEMWVMLGDGEGGFPTRLPGNAGELPIAHYTIGGALGDLNGDELPEFVHCSTLTPFLWVGENQSTPTATP